MYSNKNNNINLTITNNNVNNEDIKELVNILKNEEKQKRNNSSIENYVYFRTILDNVMKNCKKLEIKNKKEYNINIIM